VAIANGVVTFAGWDEGYGNLVRIKHASGLTSGYAHLSRIAAGIRSGRSVQQSELIGLVGQTGLATGPHLHFMMTKNGTPINPVQPKKKAEPAPPIEGTLKAEFAQLIEPEKAQLNELRANSPALTAAHR